MRNAEQNAVFSTALQFCRNYKRLIPEAVIYGYAKLLLMDEGAVRNLISDEWLQDMNDARKLLIEESKLDLELIKSGLSLLLPLVLTTEELEEAKDQFEEFLENCEETVSSVDILKQALDKTAIPMERVFAIGNGLSDILEIQKDLKEEFDRFQAENEQKRKEQEAQESGEGESEEDAEDMSEDVRGEAPEDVIGEAPEDGSEKANADAESEDGTKAVSEPTKKDPFEGVDEQAEKQPEQKSEQKAEEKPKQKPEKKAGKADQKNSVNSRKRADGTDPFAKADKHRISDPAKDFSELSATYHSLSSSLLEVVKGQERAVMKFVQGCFQGELLRDGKNKGPRSYFFFFGPPGVGKTLLAETAAEVMGRPFKVFNMSEYSDHQSPANLIGVEKHYGGTDGTLTKFVKENPESILLFDEIEKAHINVIRLFLQILSSGSLESQHYKQPVSFKDTIVIFTSNVGRDLYADRSINLSSLPDKVIVNAIESEIDDATGRKKLPPEICSRIAAGNTVMFNHLSIRHLVGMVKSEFQRITLGIQERYECAVSYSSQLPLLFIFSRGGDIDARVATSQSGRFLMNEIFELTRQIENWNNTDKKISSVNLEVDWDGMDPELHRLFVNEEKTEILVLGGEELGPCLELDEAKYKIYHAKTEEEAEEYLKQDITAIMVDPFYGVKKSNEGILSVSDYNTIGVSFFHAMMERSMEIPVYLLAVDTEMTEVDRNTFLQEGGADILNVSLAHPDSFRRQFEQVMEEQYMEKESRTFCQRGWVLDYKTKQDVSKEDGIIKVIFYDIKKRMAVDLESRGSMLSEAERPEERFADVIGAEKAKEELSSFIEYLSNPKKYLLQGHKPAQGVLLYGPPGTGKTMLAKAMAGESDVHFIQMSAAEFKSQWYGESEEKVRKIFKNAKRYAPTVLFVDEIDAIGTRREDNGNDKVTGSVLNQFLTCMQGFCTDSTKPVFVLAATNYGVSGQDSSLGELDSALVRRFDHRIYVDLPNRDERLLYLNRTLEKKGHHTITESACTNLADRTTGTSLAVLMNVIDIAYRNCDRKGTEPDDVALLDAFEEYLYGEKKEHEMDYYRRVAIHEVGHAYVAYKGGDAPSYITIESRGDFGGYMQHSNQENVPNYSKEDLIARIRCSLAGRAAETVFFQDAKAVNTGASSDLQHATDTAFNIISRYGMEEDSLVVLSRSEILHSSLAAEYVERVNEMLSREMKETIAIIESGKDVIQKIADALVARNHLTGDEFKKLIEGEDLP